ncbi:MAG: hypothetical protein QOG13_200 [Sphingomonadales bacterium]|nr:hypothetical protein [Sphingomonadales bacterium]MEA3044709.1 hypothetical protein [Sphingomonadales bacterium]
MKASFCDPGEPLGRAARQRERDEEEAGWEAQLRRMAGRAKYSEPVIERVVSPIRMALEIVGGVTRRDSLLLPRTLPVFTGDEHEDLVCGKCWEIIGFRTSAPSCRRLHPEGDRVIVRCTCGALNVLYQVERPRRVLRSTWPASAPHGRIQGSMNAMTTDLPAVPVSSRQIQFTGQGKGKAQGRTYPRIVIGAKRAAMRFNQCAGKRKADA